jgi:hypothetical protein
MAGNLSGYLNAASNLYGGNSTGSGSATKGLTAGGSGGYGGTADSSSLGSSATTISGQNTFAIGGINLGNQSAPQVDSSTGAFPTIPSYVYYGLAGLAAVVLVWKFARRQSR